MLITWVGQTRKNVVALIFGLNEKLLNHFFSSRTYTNQPNQCEASQCPKPNGLCDVPYETFWGSNRAISIWQIYPSAKFHSANFFIGFYLGCRSVRFFSCKVPHLVNHDSFTTPSFKKGSWRTPRSPPPPPPNDRTRVRGFRRQKNQRTKSN